ncbi:hypothetical protein [Blastococcus litoris]|uniref:hypothetical protein n=1 Tax=Blastococcus litoris TaxID=2171622 RepID=UPI000E302B03|nr:hypothetical protein [Blastococcus litoris]
MPGVSEQMAVPAAMPVLARGKHRSPRRGACFLEYTSLLAGEPFSDEPRCVDEELAAILRGANDKLANRDRHRLVPLLGRAIGLTVEPPLPGSPPGHSSAARRQRRAALAAHDARTAQLHRAVTRRFVAAVGPSTAPPPVRYGGGGDLFWLFWDLMSEPHQPAGSEGYVSRLVERLELLHECYEQAMDELGLPRARPAGPALGSEGPLIPLR